MPWRGRGWLYVSTRHSRATIPYTRTTFISAMRGEPNYLLPTSQDRYDLSQMETTKHIPRRVKHTLDIKDTIEVLPDINNNRNLGDNPCTFPHHMNGQHNHVYSRHMDRTTESDARNTL